MRYEKIYYADQTGWQSENFYYLNRCINKLLLKDVDNLEELLGIDVSRLSNVTKILFLANMEFQNKPYLLEYENLSQLADFTPLEEPLYLTDNPTWIHEPFNRYNIGW